MNVTHFSQTITVPTTGFSPITSPISTHVPLTVYLLPSPSSLTLHRQAYPTSFFLNKRISPSLFPIIFIHLHLSYQYSLIDLHNQVTHSHSHYSLLFIIHIYNHSLSSTRFSSSTQPLIFILLITIHSFATLSLALTHSLQSLLHTRAVYTSNTPP